MDKADGSGTILFDLKARTWSKAVLEKLDDPGRVAAADVRGPGDDGPRHGRGRGRDGPEGRHAGGGGRRRPGRGRRRRGRGAAGRRLAHARHLGRRVRDDRRPARRARGPPPRVLPRRARPLALHGRDALGRRQPAVVPRHAHAEARASPTIVAEAERAPAGSEGLLFLPYLSGERTPYPDPLARGSFVGLTLRHRRAHLTRAVLEGVAFSMKDCFGLLQGAGLGAVSEVRIAGGGAKGAAVAEDRGERPRPADGHRQQHRGRGVRRGAARPATGAGAWPSVEAACDATIAVTGRDEPVAEWSKAYADLYPRYRELYAALKPTYDALAR